MSGVDYGQARTAHAYAQGRGLAAEVLARWGAAVTPHLPRREHLDVLDLGAGTGIFTRVWPTWTTCRVIAVEPAAAMRTELIEEGRDGSVGIVAGRGEELPLRTAAVDVVWLSAVVHHLDDLDRCAAEIARVLRPDGTVFIRGLFADLGRIPDLDLLPGAARAVSAFPAVEVIGRAFEAHGLSLVATTTVEDHSPGTIGEAIDRVTRLRSVDTLLRQFTDAEVAAGLATMEAMDPTRSLGPAELGLLTFGGHDVRQR